MKWWTVQNPGVAGHIGWRFWIPCRLNCLLQIATEPGIFFLDPDLISSLVWWINEPSSTHLQGPSSFVRLPTSEEWFAIKTAEPSIFNARLNEIRRMGKNLRPNEKPSLGIIYWEIMTLQNCFCPPVSAVISLFPHLPSNYLWRGVIYFLFSTGYKLEMVLIWTVIPN